MARLYCLDFIRATMTHLHRDHNQSAFRSDIIQHTQLKAAKILYANHLMKPPQRYQQAEEAGKGNLTCTTMHRVGNSHISEQL